MTTNPYKPPSSDPYQSGPDPPPSLGPSIAEHGPSRARIGCAWLVCALLVLLGLLFVSATVRMIQRSNAPDRDLQLGFLGLILLGVGLGVAFWSLSFRSFRVTVARHGLHIRKGNKGRSIRWADLNEIDARAARSDGPLRLIPADGSPFLVPIAFVAKKQELLNEIAAAAQAEKPGLPLR